MSLGVEEAIATQVFDTYKPRSFDTLEAFAISVLAEEQDQAALAAAVRARQRDPDCKPGRGGTRATPSDDEPGSDFSAFLSTQPSAPSSCTPRTQRQARWPVDGTRSPRSRT